MRMINSICVITLIALATALTTNAATETVTYQYDDAGRLIAAAYESGATNAVVSYAYDSNGNRTNLVTIGANDTTVDADGDLFPDLYEWVYFGDLDETADGDPDGDGLSNTADIALGGNPALADTDADGMDDGDEAIAGTALNDKNDFFEIVNVELIRSGEARIWWNARAGRRYQLQQRTDLTSGTWSNIGVPYDADSDGALYADGIYAPNNAFFRLKVEIR